MIIDFDIVSLFFVSMLIGFLLQIALSLYSVLIHGKDSLL